MTLDSIILWLETYAFQGFIMVALASSLIGLLGLLLSLAFRRQSAAVRFSIWQMVTCGVVMSTALIFLVDGVAIGPVQNSPSIRFASDLRAEPNLLPMPNKHAGFQYEVPQSVSDSLANTSSPQFTHKKTSSEANEPIRVVDENEESTTSINGTFARYLLGCTDRRNLDLPRIDLEFPRCQVKHSRLDDRTASNFAGWSAVSSMPSCGGATSRSEIRLRCAACSN